MLNPLPQPTAIRIGMTLHVESIALASFNSSVDTTIGLILHLPSISLASFNSSDDTTVALFSSQVWYCDHQEQTIY